MNEATVASSTAEPHGVFGANQTLVGTEAVHDSTPSPLGVPWRDSGIMENVGDHCL